MFDGGSIVTNCRPVSKVDANSRNKYVVTAAACQEAGWEFRLVGEHDPVWSANLQAAGRSLPRTLCGRVKWIAVLRRVAQDVEQVPRVCGSHQRRV
jgi:hypothetical protein